MQATLLCISDSDKHFASAINEYEKRLGKSWHMIDYKPSKHGTQTHIIETETALLADKILQHSDHDTQIYLLSRTGKQLTSPQLTQSRTPGSKLLFIIGGPYGLNEEQLEKAFPKLQKISRGKQTMPHGLAKLVLIEQYYRVSMMHQGKSYHY